MLKKMVAGAAEQLGRRLALVSMIVGALLAALKIVIGMAAHSTAVVSDGVEAAADVLSSGIVYAGLWLASRPPDEDHPYGHGRYETVAGLVIGGLLLITGVSILFRSFSLLGSAEAPQLFALYPLLLSMVAKVFLASAKFRIGKRIGSSALSADAIHDLTDMASTLIALAAVVLTFVDPMRFHFADEAGGMAIGVVVIALAIRVVRHTVEQLVDTMPSNEKMNEIHRAAMQVDGAIGIEKCFARRTGMKYHVDLHLEVDPEMTVRESHEIAKNVKFRIKDNLDWVADVLVHVEPAGTALKDEGDGEIAGHLRSQSR